MFVIDTNVLSEFRKIRSGRANSNVVTWASTISARTLFLSAISILELETGFLLINRRDPKQGAALRDWIDGQVMAVYAGRILPVDEIVAKRCAALHVPDPRAERDSLIGATALVHGMTVVTRNTADFKPMGVALLNPWEER